MSAGWTRSAATGALAVAALLRAAHPLHASEAGGPPFTFKPGSACERARGQLDVGRARLAKIDSFLAGLGPDDGAARAKAQEARRVQAQAVAQGQRTVAQCEQSPSWSDMPKLEEIEGKLELNGESVDAASPKELEPGDRVCTGADGGASIRFSDGTNIRLDRASCFVLAGSKPVRSWGELIRDLRAKPRRGASVTAVIGVRGK